MIQPQQFFPYIKNELMSENTSLHALATKYGTPLFVYSKAALLAPFKLLQSELHGIDHTICFAMKSNSNLAVLKLLKSAGSGVDTVSGGELFRAKKAGVPAARVVFSGVGKTEEEIELALKYGQSPVYAMNVESFEELQMIETVAKRLKRPARVGFRFNPDVDAQTHRHISTGKNENKFGMTRPEVIAAVEKYRRNPWIQIKGLSIHIGSQLLDLGPLQKAFAEAAGMFETLSDALPTGLEFLDLGGGLGVQYKGEKTIDPRDYAKAIQTLWKRDVFLRRKPRLLLEPGRFISANAGVLVTKVLYRKQRDQKDFVIVDAGMTELIRPALYEAHHQVVPLVKRIGLTHTVDVVGPVCESSDYLAKEIVLPHGLKNGDLVAVLSAGAYGFSMSSQYNSRPRAAEILVDGKKSQVIRKRETHADLIKGEAGSR